MAKTTNKSASKAETKSSSKTTTKKAPKYPQVSRAIRFLPDPSTFAELGFNMPDGRNVMMTGLVLNESRTGCAIVLVTSEKIRQDDPCLCKIGRLNQGRAVVRWVTLIEKNLMKIGIEYTT